MMADSWELFFNRSIDSAHAWSMAMDAFGRGVAATLIGTIAEYAKIKAKEQFAMGLAAMGLGFLGFPAAKKSAGYHFASGAAFAALAGVAGGAAQAITGGSQVATFDPDRDGGTTREGASRGRGAQRRGLLSMRGAAPVTINVTTNITIEGNVFTMDADEFWESQSRHTQNAIDNGVIAAG
jgi:hypothetical protein